MQPSQLNFAAHSDSGKLSEKYIHSTNYCIVQSSFSGKLLAECCRILILYHCHYVQQSWCTMHHDLSIQTNKSLATA